MTLRYVVKRLFLVIFVAWAIITLNFYIINVAVPAGPLEVILAQMRGQGAQATDNIRGLASGEGKQTNQAGSDKYKLVISSGLSEEIILKLQKQFGLDKPLHTRYLMMLKNYARFDLGESFFVNKTVIELVIERMPVSMSLGIPSVFLMYIISIPLGIWKAKRNGSRMDIATDTVLIGAYAIPSFLFAVLMIVLFCGGTFWKVFPLSGIVSENWQELSFIGKILDWAWHMFLPITCMTIGGFTVTTIMTKNFFLEEINKQYVLTARAKGASEKRILFGHVFRNAMLIIIASFPATMVGMLFTGSLLLELIFSLRGLGLLGYEAIMKRDYPIIFGNLYVFSLIGLLLKILSDLVYNWIDPRIDFESREV